LLLSRGSIWESEMRPCPKNKEHFESESVV